MKALAYLFRRTMVNRIRQALRKPITYFYLVLLLFYAFLLPFSLQTMLEELRMNSPEGMAALFTVFAFWIIPANIISYAKRKGLLYRRSDSHFLFPAPVSPKLILLFAHVKTLPVNLILNFFLVLCGFLVFGMSWQQMLFYLLFSGVVENLLEGGLMLLAYGAEELTEKHRSLLVKAAYGLMGLLVLAGVAAYLKNGLSMKAVLDFLHSDAVQMVPLVGWYVAVIHLLFVGPTAVNVVCSLLYLALTALVLWAAVKMRCTGEYFEDAEKFADDYEEALSKRRRGQTDASLRRPGKVGKARVAYKGKGARAIFYRQLLEYKKNRFFIFDLNTVGSLIGSGGIAFLFYQEGGFGGFNDFILPAAMAYLILIFSAYTGKWGKELRMPYTFLIPDNPFRKLFYSTAMQLIQAFVNGCLFVIFPALVMDLPFSTAALSVLGYCLLSACKLYTLTVSEAAVGNVLGNVGKQLFQMFILGLVITAAVFGAVLGLAVGGIDLAYILMSVMLAGALAILMTISTLCFYRMETVN